MKKLFHIALCALSAHMALAAAPRREAARPRPYHPAPFPPEARKKGIEGNVVLTGDIDATGTVRSLRVLASSSPLLVDTALKTVQKWTFNPAIEDGKPIAISLNAVVQFRTDPGRPGLPRDPGSMPFAMLGDAHIFPTDGGNKVTGPDGFPVEATDGGIRAEFDVDLPHATSPKAFHVVIADASAAGMRRTVFDQALTGGGSTRNSVVTAKFVRKIASGLAAEQGLHTLSVEVDGRPAGGACYRVAGGTSRPSVKTKPRV